VSDVVEQRRRHQVVRCRLRPGQRGALERMAPLVDDLTVVLGTVLVEQPDHVVDSSHTRIS
jgi:hypothetical protein